MNDPDAEIRLLRQTIRLMREEAKQNEALLARSQQRELDVLSATSLADLFDMLTVRLASSYNVCQATLVLADTDHDIRRLLQAERKKPARPGSVILVEQLTDLAPPFRRLLRPWLGAYERKIHARIFGDEDYASVALIPLRRHGRLIGSVNLASRDPQRYTRGLASDFLAHLGVIAAFAIENAINRANLVRSGLTDVLTGWYNRRFLEERLVEEIARAARNNTALGCLFLDIDHFKTFNDRYGHAVGDAVLCGCAQRIADEIRASDVAARYGGEEFVVLLPDTSTESAALLAERIRSAVAATPMHVDADAPLSVSVSIGVASIVAAESKADPVAAALRLIERADTAMYSAKRAGRDRVHLADALDLGPGSAIIENDSHLVQE